MTNTNSSLPPRHPRRAVIEDLLQRADGLRVYTRGQREAPHKPLLLLLAVRRAQGGENRTLPWSRWRDALLPLLGTYAYTTRRRRVRPEYPFRRLIADGLWEVDGFDPEDASQFVKGQARIRDFRVSWLNERNPDAGLPHEFWQVLLNDAHTRTRLTDLLLHEHFEPHVRPGVLRDTGLVSSD